MQLSFVIPTLNEAARISEALAQVRRADPHAEIIVADGGSDDDTAARSRAAANVLRCPRGRGQQLAAGAAAAHGDVLIFLHADTVFPAGGAEAIRNALADENTIGGNFRVLFDGDSAFAAWLTGFYAWFRRHGLYYGDSAIFIRRRVYDELGGIRPLTLMEDFDLNRRMQRRGGTVCIAEPPVITSSRRFEGRRPVGIFCQWLLLHALHYLRLPGALLGRLYDTERRRTAS